jgi:hypothetical protein
MKEPLWQHCFDSGSLFGCKDLGLLQESQVVGETFASLERWKRGGVSIWGRWQKIKKK